MSFFGDGVSEIDARLGAAGVERRIGLATPHFMATVAAVAGSDLVTTISAAFAGRFAEALGLVLKPPPFDDALEITAVSTRLRAADPGLRWFRTVLREEAEAAHAEMRPKPRPRRLNARGPSAEERDAGHRPFAQTRRASREA